MKTYGGVGVKTEMKVIPHLTLCDNVDSPFKVYMFEHNNNVNAGTVSNLNASQIRPFLYSFGISAESPIES
jgi:hypothetical protein